MKRQILLGMLLILLSFHVNAQERWALELRPQVNFPTQQVDAFDLKTGFGFEAMVSYKFMPHLGVYAGWGWNNFQVEKDLGIDGLEFEETGYSIGLQFIHPFTPSLSYLLGAGGIYKHFEAEDSSGDITADTGHELGWEVQAGVVYSFGSGFELRPQVIYRSLATELELATFDSDFDLGYLSIGLGVAKRF